MESISIHSWRNEHELNCFPFVEPPVSDQGIEIPPALIVDAQIATVGDPTVRIITLSLTSSELSILMRVDFETGNYNIVASCGISEASDAALNVIGPNGLSYGKIVLGSNASVILKRMLSKIYTFKKNNFYFEPSCLVNLGSNHITSIKSIGEELRGAIALKEGRGVSISKQTDGETTYVKFNAIGDVDDCCTNNYLPLKTINTISPVKYNNKSSGNITIGQKSVPAPGNTSHKREAIRIRPISNGLEIEVV
jgi:hypothetical protein